MAGRSSALMGRSRLQHFGRRRPGFQAALGGELIHQAIGQRVAERHAQLQHIHTQLVQGQRQLTRRLQIRIARPEVHDETLVALQAREPFHNAIHAPR